MAGSVETALFGVVSLALSVMKAIVGLGTPGPRYRHTRHNVGWRVLDLLAQRWRGAKPEKARHSEVVRCLVDGEPVLLVKPQTFMNDSGKAVRALVEKDRLTPDDLLVVYDDLDLALGRIRVRAQGSAGGHRGIKSIQEHLAALARARGQRSAAGLGIGERLTRAMGLAGEVRAEPAGKSEAAQPPAFARIKVGIGRPPPGMDPIDFVLTGFTPDEAPLIQAAVERAADAAECWLASGTEAAANRFNGM